MNDYWGAKYLVQFVRGVAFILDTYASRLNVIFNAYAANMYAQV